MATITCPECLAALEGHLVPAAQDYHHRTHHLFEKEWKNGFVLPRGFTVELESNQKVKDYRGKPRQWLTKHHVTVKPYDGVRADWDTSPRCAWVRNHSNRSADGHTLCSSRRPALVFESAVAAHIAEDAPKIEAWLEEERQKTEAEAQKLAEAQAVNERIKQLILGFMRHGFDAKREHSFPGGSSDRLAFSMEEAEKILTLLSELKDGPTASWE